MLWVQYAVFGIGVGSVFALLASGIVLTYRASGVLNFAHASIGVAGAYTNFAILERWPAIGVLPALAISLCLGAAVAVAAQRFVFEPVASQSPVVKLIVSFGLTGVVQGGIGLVFAKLGTPTVRGHTLLPVERGISLAGAGVPYQRVAVIALAAASSIALALLVGRSEFGMQLRALAQNRAAARLAGVDDQRIQALTWALAGSSSALAAVLVFPFGPVNPLALNGYQLTALAAALLGGFVSLPAALLGGLGLGLLQELLVGFPAPFNGLRTIAAPSLILVLLFLRVERFFVSEQEARAVQGDERLFVNASRSPLVGSPRGWLLATVAVGVLVLPVSSFWAFVTTRAALLALLALSLVVLTGWTGQVSLMPGTFAGVGACMAWVLGTRLGLALPIVVPLAALATIPICALVGAAALRLRPLYLAVATLALAGLFDETLFRQQWFANGGQQLVMQRPSWLAGDHAYAMFVLGVVGAVFAFTAGFGRLRTGRAVRMVRDNPRAAEAGGVNPVKYRLLAFALSAAYAGLMGAMLAYLLRTFTTAEFSFLVLSLTAFGLAAVGGIRSPLGAVIGAFAFVELTELFRTSGSVSDWSTVGVGAGIVLVMARTPDGLAGLAQRVFGLFAGWRPGAPAGTAPVRGLAVARAEAPVRVQQPAGAAPAAIAFAGVTVHFGGVLAVEDLTFEMAPGEIVGVIGPNGAGKTTLLDALCGFVPLSRGRVSLDGRDVTSMLPYLRARQGLGRSFQDARLYPTMTVRETLQSAFHSTHVEGLLGEGLGLRRARDEQDAVAAAAEELLELVDLHGYLDHRVAELSFGTTRAVELTWLAARRPKVLLLDEPASGLQQSEVRVLGALIERIRCGAAVMVIDHDVPFVSSLAGRLVAMDLGRMVAVGAPEAVLRDAAVIESYLGTGRYVS